MTPQRDAYPLVQMHQLISQIHDEVIYDKDSNHSYFYSNNLKFNCNVTNNLTV